jgi:NADPH2:quinone reductase
VKLAEWISAAPGGHHGVLFALPQHLLAAAQADITKWLAAGRRIHNIAGQFPLSETAQAHMAVEKGDKIEKVTITEK